MAYIDFNLILRAISSGYMWIPCWTVFVKKLRHAWHYFQSCIIGLNYLFLLTISWFCSIRNPWWPNDTIRWINHLPPVCWSTFWKSSLNDKNIERHTADTIVSWPNPKQWVIVHTSDLMMIIRQSIYNLSIITREMSKLKTHSPCCIMDNGENMLNLTHTLDRIYLTGIL